MKLKLEEHIKHRLIGMVVIASIAILFLPALMKQSNYHFDKKMNVAIKIPAKPQTPKIDIPEKREMFKEAQITSVKIPHVKENPVFAEVNAKPLTTPQKEIALQKVLTEQIRPSHLPSIEKIGKKTSQIPSKYTVQLASFTKEKNAKKLVNKLRTQGYVATYGKYHGKNGEVYTVIIKQLEKEDAKLVRNQLAVSMRLDGLIIKVG